MSVDVAIVRVTWRTVAKWRHRPQTVYAVELDIAGRRVRTTIGIELYKLLIEQGVPCVELVDPTTDMKIKTKMCVCRHSVDDHSAHGDRECLFDHCDCPGYKARA